MRSLEDAFPIQNYFKSQQLTKLSVISVEDRSFAVQKIIELHDKKSYKMETLFTAIGIFDHYLMIKGLDQFNPIYVLHLTLVSLLMSAKLEQPMSPSFTRMIKLLPSEER